MKISITSTNYTDDMDNEQLMEANVHSRGITATMEEDNGVTFLATYEGPREALVAMVEEYFAVRPQDFDAEFPNAS